MTTSPHGWQVVVGHINDPGNPASGSEEMALVQGGEDVESWPLATGWTV